MTIGLDNVFHPYKNRCVDVKKKVKIYRNLHSRKCPEKKYSIMQNGLVVGHTNQLSLYECTFKVNKSGRKDVLRHKRKRVHAFIIGQIAPRGIMGTSAADERGLPAKITYDPYKDTSFVCRNLTVKKYPITWAMAVILRPDGVSAAYTNI